MGKLYFIALTITCLLSALCDGKPEVFVSPFCPNGNLDKDTIDKSILTPVNNYRQELVKGTQQNGGGTERLPPPKNMTQLEWGCDLEKKAIDTLNAMNGGCPPPTNPPNSGGAADIFYAGYDDYPEPTPNTPPGDLLETNIKSFLGNIQFNTLTITSQGTTSKKVIFNGPQELKYYAELMRPEAKQIGCAINKCGPPNYPWALYCILDTQAIKNGQTVYEGLTDPIKSCTDVTCPAGYACNSTTFLCVAETTATSTATTMSTATSSPTATSSSMTTSTTTTTTATTTTTIVTSPQAEFPAGGGGGGMCSSFAYANRMTNALRNEYVRLHNFRRGLLAKGEIPRKDGKLLPRAANMWSMSYDCALEDGAIKWASRCPTSLSEPSSRPNVGENFKTFPATRFNYDTAAKKSVTEWWKVIRSVNYFEKVAVFRPFHEGAPISSFTQMGWAMSNKLGCSIVKCRTSNVYVGVCRYSPRGNMVNHNIYEVGAPCSRNPGGASSCNSAEGLWF